MTSRPSRFAQSWKSHERVTFSETKMSTSAEERAARRAKALERLERTKNLIKQGKGPPGVTLQPVSNGNGSGNGAGPSVAGQSVPVSAPAASNRDANQTTSKSGLFAKPYIEYDFSTMTDSRGGFMVEESAVNPQDSADKHAQWLETLAAQQPPYDFDDPRAPKCFECGTFEIDFRLWRIFGTRVCTDCRRKVPEKYSLLTKTECKQDYLLTDPELRDTDIMPHMERPNPYQNTYSNMMLYMRYQVEEFSFKKWGGPEGLDAEYERRESQKKDRKQAKFEQKLKDMRKRTRAQAITQVYSAAGRHARRHVHKWLDPEQQEGELVARCEGCGKTRREVVL